MKPLRLFTGAIAFFTAVFLNAFVDLGHKITIQNTIFKLYDGPEQVVLTAIVNGLILLPYIALMSPAGFLSDRFAKAHVMRYSAWAALACTVLITIFYYMGWFWPAFVMTFFLAVQSAIYSPAKMGFIKELFGKERLGEANGAASALTIIAILAGIFAYSIGFEIFYGASDAVDSEAQILQSIAPIGFLLIANAALELVMMYRLPIVEANQAIPPFSYSKFFSGRLYKEDLQPLARNRAIRLSVVGLATFWSVGQVMLAAFPAFFKGITEQSNTIVVQGILACSGIGIALGSMVAGRFSKNYIETGLLPVGALGIAFGLWWLPHMTSPVAFASIFILVGFSGGMFIVPLNALIQFYAKEQELGKTLAANNLIQNVCMLSFLVLTALFAYQGWSSKSLLQFIAVVALVGCCYVVYQLPQSFVRFLLTFFMMRRYRVTVQGMKNIPARGGVLMLGNHVSWIDWAIVQIASPRPIRFVMIRNIYERWYIKWFFDLFGCIPIDTGPRSRKALDEVAECLNQGEVVCLFPEGTISRTGHLAKFRRGFERACEKVDDTVVIQPFYIRGLWGSQFSRSSSRLKKTTRSFLRRELVMAFGKPLAKTTSADVLKRRVFDLSVHSWQEYLTTLPTLQNAWITSAKQTGGELALADYTLRMHLTGHQALTGSQTLARRIKSTTSANAVGVLLPTSAPGVLVNMGVVLSGKAVVNLNYTASVSSIKAAIEQAEIDTVYTSRKFIDKLSTKGIDVTEILDAVNVVWMEDLTQSISTIEKIVTLMMTKLLPSFVLQRLWGNTVTQDDVVAILFSSGSEGAPKGVQLTHNNVMANVKQVADVINLEYDDVFMANLPLFHAFGLTVTQFLPLLESCPMICHADPTDALGGAKAIARYNATILCGTSTFFRLYCRNKKVHPLMLQSLRYVVAGAERLNPEVRDSFEQKFKKTVYEGYGATETTPVASVNLPNKLDTQSFAVQLGSKNGSVGLPLPGSSCKVVDPDSYRELPTGEAGMILIGGGQVMKGYLDNDAKTREVIHTEEGKRWYITGDKGYIDEDGYLFIVDRYSRFAKIGGEMLSLTAVETAILTVADDENFEVVVVSIPDDKKGESLVALINQPVDEQVLKQQILQNGSTAFSIPAMWKVVEAMPKLGSGKTDFVKAKSLAMQNI